MSYRIVLGLNCGMDLDLTPDRHLLLSAYLYFIRERSTPLALRFATSIPLAPRYKYGAISRGNFFLEQSSYNTSLHPLVGLVTSM